jgi:hypothetical protein
MQTSINHQNPKTNTPIPSPATMHQTLGWVSLALGLSELALTRLVSRAAGIDQKYAPVLRVFGVREITSGLGLLRGANKNAWMWSRVAGDVIDGAFLGWAYAQEENKDKRKNILLAGLAIAPIVVADIYNSLRQEKSVSLH